MGNKWKHKHTVGEVTVSSTLGLAAFAVTWFNTASERPPYSETCVQNMMNCSGAFKWHHFTRKQKRSLAEHFNISSSMSRVWFQPMLSYASNNRAKVTLTEWWWIQMALVVNRCLFHGPLPCWQSFHIWTWYRALTWGHYTSGKQR